MRSGSLHPPPPRSPLSVSLIRFASRIRLVTVLLAVGAAGPWSSAQPPQAYALQGDVAGAHDPSLIQAGRTWYVFTTGKAANGGQLGIRCSDDLTHWRYCGHVFDAVPEWIRQRSPKTRDLWAPDISFEHGEYRLFYTYSVFGRNTSGVALATNKTLDPADPKYGWEDEGMVLESREEDDFNAIDPNYFEDASHHAWLVFGSFWSGIKMRALDPKTGKLLSSDAKLYSLAARLQPSSSEPPAPGLPANWQAVEAPFLVRHGRYYYLFVSFDLCCRGVKSTYRTMVGRAAAVTGPFLDRGGVPMMQGGGTELLGANGAWLGPGGESVVAAKKGKPDLIVYHAYEHTTGKPSLQLSTLTWDDDWPSAALAGPSQ